MATTTKLIVGCPYLAMDQSTRAFEFNPIAIVRSCFKEKFAVPRQSGLAPSAQAVIALLPPYNTADYVDGLGTCSHIWLQFVFHEHLDTTARAKVRPPRLGGNKKLGVFATRSPVRPNPIGLSVVKLLGICESESGVQIQVAGIDLVDNTPILDIKPYVPYADCLKDAHNELANAAPEVIPVVFSDDVNAKLVGCDPAFGLLLQEVLGQDPRPQYQIPKPNKRYGARIGDFNVIWCYEKNSAHWQIKVLELEAPNGTSD